MESKEQKRIGRRAILAAGAAGVAAAAVRAVAAPSGVAALDHDPIKIGEQNFGATETQLIVPGSHGFTALSAGGDGIRGGSSGAAKSGVYGYSDNADGFGVFGRNTPSTAAGYLGGKGVGAYGFSSTAAEAAVKGQHSNNTGYAVFGQNTAGQSMGALGWGPFALAGWAPVDTAHAALVVLGRNSFSRSGLATIAAGSSSVNVNGIAGLGATSMVLATIQTNRPGVFIQAAVPIPASNRITIYLNRTVLLATKVAYFILN